MLRLIQNENILCHALPHEVIVAPLSSGGSNACSYHFWISVRSCSRYVRSPMLTDPTVSEAMPVTSIDTYELTINSKIDPGKDYDCN